MRKTFFDQNIGENPRICYNRILCRLSALESAQKAEGYNMFSCAMQFLMFIYSHIKSIACENWAINILRNTFGVYL